MFLKSLMHRIFERRHYWRHAGFSELAEVYAAELIKTLGLGMISVLVIIYLYQSGYSLLFIALYYSAYQFLRVLLCVPIAKMVAYLGPKHCNLISNILLVPTVLSLSFLEQYGWPVLVIFALLQAVAVSLYWVSYYVNFSKIKHADHAGKEIGYVIILRRVAAALSPLFGGIIAFYFGPQSTIYVASILILLAAWPLLQSAENSITKQRITFKDFRWRPYARNFVAHGALGMDSVASLALWPLFIAIAIFGAAGNDVYAKVGAVASVSIISALAVTHIFGKVVDRQKGGVLLRYSGILNALLHLSRPLVTTPYGIVATNIANETVTVGVQMPFQKAMFDAADSLPGYRVVYLTVMETAAALGAALFYLIIALAVFMLGEIKGMQLSFLIVAPLTAIVVFHGFKLLDTKR